MSLTAFCAVFSGGERLEMDNARLFRECSSRSRNKGLSVEECCACVDALGEHIAKLLSQRKVSVHAHTHTHTRTHEQEEKNTHTRRR